MTQLHRSAQFKKPERSKADPPYSQSESLFRVVQDRLTCRQRPFHPNWVTQELVITRKNVRNTHRWSQSATTCQQDDRKCPYQDRICRTGERNNYKSQCQIILLLLLKSSRMLRARAHARAAREECGSGKLGRGTGAIN